MFLSPYWLRYEAIAVTPVAERQLPQDL